MKKKLIAIATLAVISANAVAATAYLSSWRRDGTVIHCYYKYAGQTYVRTINGASLCAQTISV